MAPKAHKTGEAGKNPLLMLEKVFGLAPRENLREEFTKILAAVDVSKRSQVDILHECLCVAAMLIFKNQQYGDSALNPLRVFSKATPEEGMNIRLDDKLSRIARGAGENEDPEFDIIGYLVLKRIGKKRCQRK
jgi:hypothetical protein